MHGTPVSNDLGAIPMDARIRAISDYLKVCAFASDFDPRDLSASLLRYVYILGFQRGEDLRMWVQFAGTAIDHRFNRSVKGEFLDSYGHKGHNPQVLDGFQRCAREQVPVWMRQVIRIDSVFARYIEGVAYYLHPDRIYGGLVTGDIFRKDDNEPALRDTVEVIMLPGPAKCATRRRAGTIAGTSDPPPHSS